MVISRYKDYKFVGQMGGVPYEVRETENEGWEKVEGDGMRREKEG